MREFARVGAAFVDRARAEPDCFALPSFVARSSIHANHALIITDYSPGNAPSAAWLQPHQTQSDFLSLFSAIVAI